MKIRQKFGNEQNKIIDIEFDALDIISDDENVLFSIKKFKDGSIEVFAEDVIHHDCEVLSPQIQVQPIALNMVKISRLKVD